MGKKNKNKKHNEGEEKEKSQIQETQQLSKSSKEQSKRQNDKASQSKINANNEQKSKEDKSDKKNQGQHHEHHHKPRTHKETKSGDEKYPHYTWQEVSKHDHKDDLWIVLQDGVYNLTKMVDKHPGGSRVIAMRAGRKANKAFAQGNHPPRVMEKTLPHYRVGSIREDSMIESWQRESKTGRMDLFISTLIGVGIIGFMTYMTI